MNTRGFTLLELITCLLILAIIMLMGIPSFATQLRQSQLKTSAYALMESIQLARATSVFHNKRTVLLPQEQDWNKGWELFIDRNNNGVRDEADTLIKSQAKLDKVKIQTTRSNPLRRYVSFIGTGEGRKVGRENGGAFLAGTLKICPLQRGEGYALVLARGGRTRVKIISASECGF
jgi:type IV fimbrial biogenesis protein FimT